MHTANGLEALMNQLEGLVGVRGAQPGPSLHCMKTQAPFVAEPALVDFDISPADGSIDRSLCCGDAGNAATLGPGRMIDAQIAAGAAAAADGVGSRQEPG